MFNTSFITESLTKIIDTLDRGMCTEEDQERLVGFLLAYQQVQPFNPDDYSEDEILRFTTLGWYILRVMSLPMRGDDTGERESESESERE